MAKLILSDIISDIRGTVGTHTYSYWKGVHLVKNRSVNYRTAWESEAAAPYRSFIARVSQHWYGGLSQAQRDGWEAYAAHIATMGYPYYGPGVIKLVGWRQYGGIMSGVNAFVLTNQLRWSIGKTDILEDDPLAIYPPPFPVFSALEWELGPPKKLKATIQRPITLTENTWARVFCRGHKMAHLMIAQVGQVAAQGQPPWDDIYNCDVEPPAATPAWTLNWVDFCAALGTEIEIDTVTPGGVSRCYYSLAVPALNAATGYMIEFKMRVLEAAAMDSRLEFVFADGTYTDLFRLSDSKVKIIFGNGEYAMDTTDKLHTYLIARKGTNVKVYVDGVLRIDVTSSHSSGVQFLYFGDSNPLAGENSISRWDFIRWWTGGDVPVASDTLEWDVMRYAQGSGLSLQNDLYSVQTDFISENGRYGPPSAIMSQMVRSGFPGGLWGSEYWNNYVWG